MPKLLILLFAVAVLACCGTTDEVTDAAYSSAAVPVLTSYSAYSGTKSVYQGSAITLHLPDTLYAEEVNRDELARLVPMDNVFPAYMAYLGARNGYDYYVYMDYINAKSQRILKVKNVSNFNLDTLSVNPSRWQVIKGYGMDFEVNMKHNLFPFTDVNLDYLTPSNCDENKIIIDITDDSPPDEQVIGKTFNTFRSACTDIYNLK